MIELAGNVGELLAQVVVDGTIVAAFTALLAIVLRRVRPALLAALWTVALLKFLVPVAPQSPLALGALLGDVADVSRAVGGAPSAPSISAQPALVEPGLGPWWPAMFASLVCLWLLAAAALTCRRAILWQRMRKRVLSLPYADGELEDAARDAARAVGLERIPSIRVDVSAASAYLFGCWSPVLVMPSWVPRAHRRAILLHELAHVRRRDSLIRALQVVATTLFFFWPPVRWITRQIDLLREQACDRWAVERGGIRAAAYARVLVDVAARGQRLHAPALAFAPRPGHLERRVVSLMSRRHKPGLSAAMVAVVVGYSALALAEVKRDSQLGDELLCATDPRLGRQILLSHPDADTDGDGALSKEEVCAHQMRMQRRLVDVVVDDMPKSQLRRADVDGDGTLSESELRQLKDRLIVAVRSDASSAAQLVLRYEDQMSSEVGDGEDFALVSDPRISLSTAEVSGSICEARIGRCVADERDERSASSEAFLLIDVAVTGDP